jgi:two-component system, chemotaxis family, CheB/CheR fusion protein
LPDDNQFQDVEVAFGPAGPDQRIMLVNGRRLARSGDREDLILLAVEEITARKRSEELGQRLAAIVASSDDAIISKDLNGIITSWNQGAERLFGYTAEEAIGKSILILIPPERRDEETRILENLRRGEHLDHFETVRIRKDGSPVWISLTVSPVKDAKGDVIGGSKIARDMTESRHAAAQQEMLIGELSHRVKNVLATVQAIMSQTIRQSTSLNDFQMAFEGRLRALARAHDLLVDKNWTGAEIGQLVSQTLAPYRTQDAGHIAADGPQLTLPPQASVALVMILHELATNAAKYGALSRSVGKLEVTWQRADNDGGSVIRMQWSETGGPPVKPPARQGFGTKLIERSTAYELSGQARLDYAPEGLHCELIFPWTQL